MKKSLKKVIGTVAAFTALTAVMAVSASAAEIEAGQGISFTATAAAEGEQVTILILKDGESATDEDGITDDEIAYIDQQSAVALADGTYGYEFKNLPVETSEGQKYEVFAGAESKTEATTGTVTVTGGSSTVNLGDITGDQAITAKDALPIMYYAIEDFDTAGFDETNWPAAADTTGDSKLTAADALQIMYFVVEDIDNVKFDYSWTGYEG